MTEQSNANSSTPPQMLMLLFIALVLGLIFDQLFYMKIPGISWLIFVVAMLVGLLVLTRLWRKRLSVANLWLIVPIVALSAMVTLRDSAELTFFNIVATLFLLLLLAAQITGKPLRQFLLLDYIKTALTPFLFIPKFFEVLVETFTMRMGLMKNPKAGAIVKGVIMAIPALIVFALLFSSADLVFKKYITDIFSFDIPPDLMARIGLVLLIGAVMLGAYGYILKTHATAAPTSIEPKKKIGSMEIHVMLGLINALFLIFIVVQLRYLFGGQSTIEDQGFTYAQYARRGFFELIAAAIVAFLIVWASEQSIIRPNNRLPVAFSWLSILLNVQLIMLMVSAFQRMNLYEQAYGFTTSRWFAHVFIVWLSILVLMFIYKLIRHQGEAAFLRHALGLAVIFLLAANVANPDSFVAEKNWERYERSGKLDPYYLTQLSADATPVVIKALNSKNTIVRGVIGQDLWEQQQYLQSTDYRRWPSFNLSRQQAKTRLAEQRTTLESLKNYKLQPDMSIQELMP